MTDLIVQVCADADDERHYLLHLTGQLGNTLLDELDVEAVDSLAPTAPPNGSKAGGLVEILGIRLGIVTLKKVIDKIREWTARSGRNVKVTIDGDTIELTGGSAAQHDQIVSAWLARHAARD